MKKKMFSSLAVGLLACSAYAADEGALSGEVIGGNDDLVVAKIALLQASPGNARARLLPQVAELEEKGFVSTDVGDYLNPDLFLLNHDGTDDLVYTAGQFTARGNNTFTVDQVRFELWSADQSRVLHGFGNWTNMNFVFDGLLIGTLPDGTRATGETKGVQLKKLTFGAFAPPRWTYPDQLPYETLANYITNELRTVWFALALQGGSNNFVAYSKRMLTVNPVSQTNVNLSITVGTNNIAFLRFTNVVSQTAILQRTPALEGTNTVWTDIASANQGVAISEPMTNTMSFYRLFLQGSH